MTQYIIANVIGWHEAVEATQDPNNTISTIQLADNIVFRSMDEIYGGGGVLGGSLMTLRAGQVFDGNGFTITIDAPPYEGFIGIQGLFSLDVMGRCAVRNLKVVLTDRSMIGNPDNPYAGDSVLVAYNNSVNPRGLICENVIIESDAMLVEGCCLMHSADYPCEARGCFVRIGSRTTEAPLSGFSDFHQVYVFSTLPGVVRDCALASDHDFRTLYPCYSAGASQADVSRLYMDLSIQTPIPDHSGLPPSALAVLIAGESAVSLDGVWIWWGNPTDEPSGVSLADQIGYYDFFDDPVPGHLIMNNTATNITTAARYIEVGGVSVGSNVSLSVVDWTTFPVLTDQGFDYTYNPPVLTAFREYPFYAQAIISAMSLPAFRIGVYVIHVMDNVMTARATAAVGSSYDLSYPLSYWVQGGNDSNSTTDANDSPWTILPDNQRESRPVAIDIPGTPSPKLQTGLTTFAYPRMPQYYFVSVPLYPPIPRYTIIVLPP